MRTSIEWATHSWNPGIYGCAEVSPACANCYAAGMAHRLDAMGTSGYHTVPGEQPITTRRASGVHWSGEVRVAQHPNFGTLPRRRGHTGERLRVFTTSMSDVFHDAVPFAFLDELFDGMVRLGDIADFLVLTKRSKRMLAYHRDRAERSLLWPRNVWAGVTAENQAFAEERIPDLLRVPAPRRFVSAEPLLGPINFRRIVYDGVTVIDALDGTCGWPIPHSDHGRGAIDWLIVGGESGSRARPTHPDWFREIRAQCDDTGVPFFFKQWGAWTPLPLRRHGPARVKRWEPGSGWVDSVAVSLDRPRDTGTPRVVAMWRHGGVDKPDKLDGVVRHDIPSRRQR